MLTETLLVSGSAMTPDVLRSKSPMLRVMASLPLTWGWPKLFQVIKPPVLRILQKQTHKDQKKCSHSVSICLEKLVLQGKLYLSFSSFLSGVWSTVSLRALPLRHSMARLSPTLPTTSSIPSLSRATVAVVPALNREAVTHQRARLNG